VTAVLALAAILMQGQAPTRDARPVTTAGTASITGLVLSTDPQPRPLRRARVTLNGPGLDVGRTAITADDGSFSFERLPSGRFTLAAAKDGYVSMSYGATRTGHPGSSVQVAERQAVRVSLRLPRGAVITGTIVDVDGLASPGIGVTALARRYVGTQGSAAMLAPACRRSRCRTIAASTASSVFRPAITSSPRSRSSGRAGSRRRSAHGRARRRE
jgi:hypothetical protein